MGKAKSDNGSSRTISSNEYSLSNNKMISIAVNEYKNKVMEELQG